MMLLNGRIPSMKMVNTVQNLGGSSTSSSLLCYSTMESHIPDYSKEAIEERSASLKLLEEEIVVPRPAVKREKAKDYKNNDSLTVEMRKHLDLMYMYRDTAPMMNMEWRNAIHPLLMDEGMELSMDATVTGNETKGLSLRMEAPRYTKVKLTIPLKCFSLNEDEINILLQLVGPRYNKHKKHIKITSDRYRTRVLNHKHCCNIVRDLIDASVQEAKQLLPNAAE